MTSTAQHTQVVQKQFGEQAAAYLSSAVHAQGTEFALLQAELAGQGEARVLDLGCGAGHVSFHVAPLVKEVVAYDLSQQMLDVVAAAAVERGMSNIATVNGAAERLSFADGEFDFVFSRYSAHHWSDLGVALREVRRVLKPGGRLAVVTFHSLEDRLVKRFFRERSGALPGGSRHLPQVAAKAAPSFETVGRAVRADEQEIARNPRARSATLRVAQRTAAAPWPKGETA